MLATFQRKQHWVSDVKATHCALAGCGKPFNMRVRRHHCRMCGLVFCDEHSSRRLRLGPDSKPSDTGEMQRVCDGCVLAQQAHSEPTEAVRPVASGTALRLHVAGEVSARDVTLSFSTRRAAHNAEKRKLTVPLVEAYSRLCQLNGANTLIPGIPGAGGKRVVAWEADAAASSCAMCHRGFTQLLRKHHCRLCGLVVCGDCSAKRSTFNPEDGSFLYRSCTRCHELLSRANRSRAFMAARSKAATSDFSLVYASLSQAARTVREEIALFETQVNQFGTQAATATLDDAHGTQQRLEQALASLLASLKRFNAIPALPHEAQFKDQVKRAPAALLQEGMPVRRSSLRA